MDRDSLAHFIRREVPDWDDEVVATARFKAFSGQRSDWEPRYQFWRDLILRIARRFGLLLIEPSQVMKEWFNRGGLTPLCVDHVLSLMYDEGDILRKADLGDPSSGRLSQILRKVRLLVVRPSSAEAVLEDSVILAALLKEKACEVLNVLSESSWTSSCIVTRRRFQEICGGPEKESIILSYLSGCRKAQYLSIHKKEFIEGVKVSLTAAAVSTITSLDHDVLHLIWTTEKLQQQLDLIDQRYEKTRSLAAASLKAGNKKVALRYARELKLASESREKCAALLNRVEEVLQIVSDAESTKKVSEAIQIGARAMKENKISVGEVELCLEEIDESIDFQKQVEKALESTSTGRFEDEDVADELRKLELEVGKEHSQIGDQIDNASKEAEESEYAASLSEAFSNLKLEVNASEEIGHDRAPRASEEERKNSKFEAEAA
ncbi:charged multivesicular body protein 7 isoform X1 [Rhodamnia argentea]|uniref:Charged multivesicular body protein 7 isoform X1 n=2 Tax=Rhodamnia argentea TaxID=178133 RepID=A0A8B8PZJ3_9MYRT|nr:charged multivesicular body protein 7 isoform X1 [Rhodamnia argentea]